MIPSYIGIQFDTCPFSLTGYASTLESLALPHYSRDSAGNYNNGSNSLFPSLRTTAPTEYRGRITYNRRNNRHEKAFK